ncbi:MAG: OPT/YSL family transporter [Atopobiaceae bacterium]|nr:OPT/YSL family transporter [Atopobiaceae bacterium]MCH4180437.1 OPT/YSL family transporter [Atopobiaceae bacterium]MCH4214608.1 OPT/YSL family transporter [Atopobiaceae bacterium]MCH4230414.1 OPT/YSL family transporter [Atopobiaceae bacterium]MCH4275797.1 OPT/YSL family transporter [Atopobiaceae bacterium]
MPSQKSPATSQSIPGEGAGERPRRAATPRALIIGAIGSAVLTASSLYIALKMGALPWPIVFAALVSVLALRLFGSSDLHEANVCHAAMSAGSMVAGGLAFTIPGLWILGTGAQVSLPELLVATLSGTALGLVACACLQPYFIRQRKLAYPIGASAAETLKATADAKSTNGRALFGGMGVSALYAFLRDNLGLLPSRLFASTALPGVSLGIYNSPMMMAMGFIVGVVPAGVWFLGALIGNFGVGVAFPALGICDVASAGDIRTSLGLGLMLGVGGGVILRNVIPAARRAISARRAESAGAALGDAATTVVGGVGEGELTAAERARRLVTPRSVVAIVVAIVACVAAFALGLGLLPSIVMVVGAWFCVYLSGWLTGTTGVNPMEIFGVLVLLLLQVLFHDLSIESLFLASAVVAVACGICGDVMNDLKAGDELATPPAEQFSGMVVGGLVGAVVAALLLYAMGMVYGPDAFGADKTFVAAQASVVASMAGGIPNVPAFVVGIVAGCVMAAVGLPVMTLGLGVYLPFYLSAGAAVGALVRFVFDRMHKGKDAEKTTADESKGQAIAAGLLGGESLVGVISAFVALAGLLAG